MRRQPLEVARVISARAAMRVLPFMHEPAQYQPEDRPDRRLTLFRANAIAFSHAALRSDKQITEAADAIRTLTQLDSQLYGSTKVASRAIVAISTGFPVDGGQRAENAAKAITTSQFSNTGTVEAAAADAASLYAGLSAVKLVEKPLWPQGCSDSITQSWVSFRDDLLTENEHWEVWTIWYEARLAGAPYDPVLERQRVLYGFENDRQPVAAANSALSRIIADHQGYPALLPEERATPMAFVRADEQIDALPIAVSTERANLGVIAAAHAALSAMMEDFASGSGGAQFPKLATTITRCRAALGANPASIDVIGLGVHVSVLSGFTQRADEFLLPEDAAQLSAIETEVYRFLSQFDEWGQYASTMATPLGTADAETQAFADAQAAMSHIMDLAPDLFSDRAKEALAALHYAALPDGDLGSGHPTAAGRLRSYLRAVRSALFAVAIWVLDQVKQGTGKGIQATVGIAAAAVLTGASMLLVRLASGLPAEFGFLSAILSYLSRLAAGS